MPSLARTDPEYVDAVLTAAAGGSAISDIGLLDPALVVEGIMCLAGGLLFGIALFRARVLARWSAALPAVAAVLTFALPVLPDNLYRALAYPNALALIGLASPCGAAQSPRRHRKSRPGPHRRSGAHHDFGYADPLADPVLPPSGHHRVAMAQAPIQVVQRKPSNPITSRSSSPAELSPPRGGRSIVAGTRRGESEGPLDRAVRPVTFSLPR
jgi:hypothetical protein